MNEEKFIGEAFPENGIPLVNLGGAPPGEVKTGRKIFITDSTFSEAQQTRAPFKTETALNIFKLLSAAGGRSGIIRDCDFSIYEKSHQKIFSACRESGLKFPQISACIKCRKEDIATAVNLKAQRVSVVMPCSDYQIFLKMKMNRQEAMNHYKNCLSELLDKGMEVKCSLEDITRADMHEFVLPLINELCKIAGQRELRFRLCDTLGLGMPFKRVDFPRGIPSLLCSIMSRTPLKTENLEWHGHNDLQLATANAISAWLHGCMYVNGTVLGIGDRSSIAATEALLLHWIGLTGENSEVDFMAMSDLIELMKSENNTKNVETSALFADEYIDVSDGIHPDGISRKHETYSDQEDSRWSPRKSRFKINSSSGLAGITMRLNSIINDSTMKLSKESPEIRELKKNIEQIFESGRKNELTEEEFINLACKFFPFLKQKCN